MSDETTTADPAVGAGSGERPSRPSGPVGREILTALLAFLVLGIVCGVAWRLLVHPAVFTKVKSGGSMGEVELGKRFAMDGWYVVVAAVAGLLSGGVVTWRRSRDPLLTVGLVVAGSVVAAAVMAYTGHLLGPGDPNAVLAHAPNGARVPVQFDVTARAAYLVWPIAALLGSLAVLWSKPLEPEL